MATATAETGTVSQDDGASVNATIANEKSKTLPKSSREKIGKLKRAWSAYGYKSGALYEAQQDAHARRAELAVQIGHLKRTIENQRGIIGAADHKRLADLESQHTECLTEIAELVAESANLPSPFDPRVIAAFLANAGSRRLKASVPTVALRKGQTAIAALNEIRNEISDLVEAIDDIRTAPLPKNDSITNAVAEIERIAAKGAPYFGRCRITEPGANGRTRVGTVRWPLKFDDTGQESIDSGSMLIWSIKDQLIAKATEELTALDSEEAVSLAGRKERVSEIEALILSLERKEEILIGLAAGEGVEVSRRSTMNPLAILGVEFDDRALPTPKPEPEPEETDADRAASLRRARLRDRTAPSELKTDGADPHDFG